MAVLFVKERRLYTKAMMILVTMQFSVMRFSYFIYVTHFLHCNDFIVFFSVQGTLLIHISHLLKMKGAKKLIL